MLALPRSLPRRKIMQAYIAKANGRIAQGRCTPAQRKTWLALMAFDAPTRLRLRISLLSSAEIDDVIMPCKQLVQKLVQKLCAGVATENQHIALTTHIAVALQIEQACECVGCANTSKAPTMPAAIRTTAAVKRLVAIAIAQPLTKRRFARSRFAQAPVDSSVQASCINIVKKLASRTKQQGGQVVRVSNEELGLQA